MKMLSSIYHSFRVRILYPLVIFTLLGSAAGVPIMSSPIVNANGMDRLVSVDSNGLKHPGAALNTYISADGTYVAFTSDSQLTTSAPAPWFDPNNYGYQGFSTAYVYSVRTKKIVWNTGVGSGNSIVKGMSADGREVLFCSGGDMVGDSGGGGLFVRNLETGITQRASTQPNGEPGYGEFDCNRVIGSAISSNGRYVIFSTTFLTGSEPGNDELWVRDLVSNTTEALNGIPSWNVGVASISDDGRFVAYSGGPLSIYDRNTSRIVQVANVGSGTSSGSVPRISPDGSMAVFEATPDGASASHVYIMNISNGQVKDITPTPNTSMLYSKNNGNFSSDSRYVTFASMVSLTGDVTDGTWAAYVYDTKTDSIKFIHNISDSTYYYVGVGNTANTSVADNINVVAYIKESLSPFYDSQVYIQTRDDWQPSPLTWTPLPWDDTPPSVPGSTPPVLYLSVWSQNPKPMTGTTTLTVPAASNTTGIAQAEYFIGDDPGQGNGTPMTLANQVTNPEGVVISADLTAEFGSELVAGTHKVYVRAQDLVGNWSDVAWSNLIVSETSAITSDNHYTLNVRDALDFTITTTGVPTPSITESGSLPAGVTFNDNGDGTATLTGQPAANTAGAYLLTFTADNGIDAPATQEFVLTVTNNATTPAFISDSDVTVTYGIPFTFTVNTSGNPAPSTITKSGALPNGVTFVDNGDGTATLSGTPAASALGVYTLKLKAKSGKNTATQTLTLTVTKAPVFITKTSKKTGTVGKAFTFNVKSKGYYMPTLTATNLPDGLVFTDNGDGTGAITGTPSVGAGGTYDVTITASNQDGTTDKVVTLNINEVPVFTSTATMNVPVGNPFNFQFSASGFPAPKFSRSGKLPKGVTFSAATGTLSGTPAVGTEGTYHLIITARNSQGSITQDFYLIVGSAVPAY
jgi:hypothetical protein